VDNGGRYIIDSTGKVVDKCIRQKKDELGHPMFDERGNPVMEWHDDSGGRWKELSQLTPRYSTTSNDDGRTHLVASDVIINNNPDYWPNMIDSLNTPFDHIERILLQDFNDLMFKDGGNYFKGLFKFTYRDDGRGLAGFTMSDPDYPSVDFSLVNCLFAHMNLFLDSFTYTSFVDYAQSEDPLGGLRGIYSDEFLTDYNTGKYNSDPGQVDEHRQTLTSQIYQLKDLEQDLESAKMDFREDVAKQDKKVYIYTFCEHLATLFAKLSNIRMSHEMYGFKHPHRQWEGILALDIWYQLLYKTVDA